MKLRPNALELTSLVAPSDLQEVSTPMLPALEADAPQFLKRVVRARNFIQILGIVDRVALYHALVVAAVTADYISTNDKAWDDFRAADLVSKKLAPTDRTKALRWAVEAATGRNAQSVSLYVRALSYLKKTGTPSKDILSALHASGIRTLAASGSNPKSTTVTQTKSLSRVGTAPAGTVSSPKGNSTSVSAILRLTEKTEELLRVPLGQKVRLTVRMKAVGKQLDMAVTKIKRL